MSVSSALATYTNATNGVSLAFSFPFKIQRETDIAVTLTIAGVETVATLVPGGAFGAGPYTSSQYIVVPGFASLNSFTIQFFAGSAPATGTVRADRLIPLVQTTQFNSSDMFPAATVEAVLDRVMMGMQMLALSFSRVVTVSGVAASLVLPAPVASQLIGWNASATGFQYYTALTALTGDVTTVGSAATVGKINGVSLAGLGTGLLKNTTGTGVPSIAVAGTDYIVPGGSLGTPSALVLTNATGLPLTTGVTGVLPVANGGTGVGTSTGSGSVVLSTSPTLVTPLLGTPTSGTLTNCTGLPVATGISGLAAGIATFLATPSSANLIAAVTDETGTGALVFGTSPTLTTPLLGTPTSGTLTNCTGLPISTGVSGLAAGVATFLATPSSANLLAAMTVKTGTGSLVFATSPTLVTPVLGTPSSGTLTSCTGLPISTGVSGLGTNVATFLATPSSANLAAAITDETGTGALVFATSPTLVTPLLGTPTSGTLTNCTGLPVATGISGLATGIATFLATPSSANLAAAITDETGTGALMFGTNPTINGYTEGVSVMGTVGASATLVISSAGVVTATLTTATPCTFTMPTATAGKSFTLYLKQPAAGSPTTGTFTGVHWWNNNTAPVITATLSRMDILSFCSDGTNWYGTYAQNFT